MQYPVYCVWCEEQGKLKIIGYCEVKHSHGICEECKKGLLGRLFSEADNLMIRQQD